MKHRNHWCSAHPFERSPPVVSCTVGFNKYTDQSAQKPNLYTTEFELSWNLMGFFQEREYVNKDPSNMIGEVITLSGGHKCVQALAFKEHMEQIWPSTGLDFVQLFEHLVETSPQNHWCK
jgi:hypothetical protein